MELIGLNEKAANYTTLNKSPVEIKCNNTNGIDYEQTRKGARPGLLADAFSKSLLWVNMLTVGHYKKERCLLCQMNRRCSEGDSLQSKGGSSGCSLAKMEARKAASLT